MPSLEILVENPKGNLSFDRQPLSFAVKVSTPPLSDREPSLWQKQFTQLGGVLVHLGDPDCRDSKTWYSAYSLIDEEDCKRFRFKRKYWSSIQSLLELLTSQSLSGTIHFTSDWQFGPTAKRYARSQRLSQFVSCHNRNSIRFNSWMTIKADSWNLTKP